MPDGFLFPDESDAQAACEWWRGQLGLTDWNIKLTFARAWDLGKDVVGDTECCVEHKWADIRLLAPGDAKDMEQGFMRPVDQEDDLVHELGEVILRKIRLQATRNTDMDWNFEQTASTYARALVSLRRQAYPGPPWRCKENGHASPGLL